MARSRPSCSTSTRRLSEELKPRAFTLKSLTPLCTTSTPGTVASAIGAWPVVETASITCGVTVEIAAGASTTRSGVREAVLTTMSPTEIGTASRTASAVTSPSALTVTRCSTARKPSERKAIVCSPAGTRRRVKRPSLRVVAVRPDSRTETVTPASAVPSFARVTRPTTVPVAWAAATDGASAATTAASARTTNLWDTNAGRAMVGLRFSVVAPCCRRRCAVAGGG